MLVGRGERHKLVVLDITQTIRPDKCDQLDDSAKKEQGSRLNSCGNKVDKLGKAVLLGRIKITEISTKEAEHKGN